MNGPAARAPFRERLRTGQTLTGTFVKTPSAIVCEVLAQSRLDAVCLDAEHAPFGRVELDACIHALRSGRVAPLVRVAAARPEYLLQALDSGATGILVPHVTTAEQAADLARRARFGPGGRGYAGSPRAAGYGTVPMAKNLERADRQTTLIAQIEDPEAFDEIDAIAAVDGIDALFVGRIDLTVAIGSPSPDAPEVIEMVETICASARRAGKAAGMFLPGTESRERWIAAGATLFMAASDHAFLRRGADALHRRLTGDGETGRGGGASQSPSR